MPKWIHSKEGKKYIIYLFPLIGVVIAALMYAFSMLSQQFGFGQSFFALIGAVIPVMMSGGVHLTGFMKTSEVLFANRFKAKKQESIKDIHVGESAVIAAGSYYLLYAGGLVLIWKERQLLLLGIGYILSRTLSGMAAVWFPEAEKGKMPCHFSSKSQRQTARIILSIILALCVCTCIVISPIMGVLESLLCMWIWTYYYYMSKGKFGGISEELTGYFLTLCELAVVLFVGVFGRVFL